MTIPFDNSTRVASRPSPVEAATPALGYLTVTKCPDPGLVGTRFPLRVDDASLGRESGCTIALNDQDLSRYHARVFVRDGAHYLSDMNSTNGSCINGSRIQEQLLRTGDVILIGSTALRYERA